MKDISNMNFIEMEHEILKFWEDDNCFKTLQEKNKDKKPFRFLDGPVTANNPMGVHHAWGRTLKDVFLRYKSMTGHTSHYCSGFDGQGLWVEVEVEKELGFKNKKDVEDYGLDRFTSKCMERVDKYSKIITGQSKRLGQWMDWENSYYTNTDENITAIWHFLKVCAENGWIKKAARPMPWCPRCGTSLSEHEMTGSYKTVEHVSVFAKLPVKGKDFDILVWTTTPWTLSANIALAVNPELEYFVVKCQGLERPIVLCKNAIKYIEGEKQVLSKMKGEELVSLEYETFFPEFEAQKGRVHKILPWKDVAADEGSGVVHIAPGCGLEDFELCKPLGIEGICPVDESGIFYEGYGFLSGKNAKLVAEDIFEELKKQNKFFKTQKITHSYPVCWRCKTEILFRLVSEWFICTEEIKPKLLAANETIKWEPAYMGKRMSDWLVNMGDWGISRKRFYGLPLPIFECPNCGKVTVVGSKEELERLGAKGLDKIPHLHRPWVDELTIDCPKCGEKVKKISDVGDVWLDAGIVPFSTLKYFEDKEYWNKYYPAEWITEMKEQVRLWFYSMLFMSVTLTGKAPYEHVTAYASVVSEDGSKFSKTGFMIKFEEAAEKLGSDVVRYLFAGANITNDVKFGFNLGEEVRRKLLGFWNIYVFFNTYASIEGKKCIKKVADADLDATDRWLNARVKQFVSKAKAAFEGYWAQNVIAEFERCVDDISNWYIRINRKRFWQSGDSANKLAAYSSLYDAIKKLVIVMAPIIPFMTEFIWQNLIRQFEEEAEVSVHFNEFVELEELLPEEEKLLLDTEFVRKIINLALKIRNENQLKVKQPLKCLSVVLPQGKMQAVTLAEAIIKDELNVKKLELLQDDSSLQMEFLTVNFKEAGNVLKSRVNEFKQALEKASAEELAEAIKKIKANEFVWLSGMDVDLAPELFVVNKAAKTGLKLAQEGELIVALDITLSDELINEGIFREIVRNCQVARKEAGFKVEQRIKLALCSEAKKLNEVLFKFSSQIAKETLAVKFLKDLEDAEFEKDVTLGNDVFKIKMARIGE